MALLLWHIMQCMRESTAQPLGIPSRHKNTDYKRGFGFATFVVKCCTTRVPKGLNTYVSFTHRDPTVWSMQCNENT
jgi:hypothetical protein